MKLWKLIGLALLGSFIVLGCATATPYPYALETESSATISLKTGNPNLTFVSLGEQKLPPPERGTRWEPIVVPANRTLSITVHAYYEHQSKVSASGGLLGAISATADLVGTVTRGVDTDVLFLCPSLSNGGKYQLSFKKESGVPGKNILVLTDLSTKKVVHEHPFE